MNCWHCGQALQANSYGRGDICISCKRDTRVCKNCTNYEKSLSNECKEPQADRVVEKERSNFCDYFKPGSPKADQNKSRDSLKAAADALFKKK